ncbi:MAG: DUF3352 domain-containing protein [Bacteroidales bacterium]
MSKRTRYFMIGAVATLVFGLSIGLVAYYNGGLPQLGGGSGPEQLRYVPADAAVVAYADVHKIMNSEFRQRMKGLQAGKGEQGQQEFKAETGIDLEKDVDNVVAFMTPAQPDNNTGGAVLVTGKFDQGRIEQLITGKGGQPSDYRGKRVLTFMRHESREGTGPETAAGVAGALVFLRGNLVVVGSEPIVRKVVDLGEGPAMGIKTNEKMEKLIADVAPKGNAWVVGRFDALTNHANLPQEVTSRIPPISWFSASGEIDGGVAADLMVETTDANAAANLAMVIQGLKGLAGLQAGANAEQMKQALQAFSVRQDGPQLTVSFRLPTELLYGLAAPMKKGAAVK